MADWTKVADLAELPGEGLGHRVKVSGLDLALFLWNQRVFALEDICPHRGFPLSDGIAQGGEVICSWHGWRIRMEDGGCRFDSQSARTYPAEIRGTEVWVQV